MEQFDVPFCLRGQGSDSEGEELGGEGDVILPQDLPGWGNSLSQQSVVRLSEVSAVEASCRTSAHENIISFFSLDLG